MGCPSVHPSICQAVLFLLPSDRPSARLLFVSRSDPPPANPSARPPDRHSRQLSALPSARRKVTHVCTNVRPSYCPCAWLSDEATDRPSVRPRRTAIFSSPSPSSLSPIGPSVPSSDRPSDQPTERPVRLPLRPDRPSARLSDCPFSRPFVRSTDAHVCCPSFCLSNRPCVHISNRPTVSCPPDWLSRTSAVRDSVRPSDTRAQAPVNRRGWERRSLERCNSSLLPRSKAPRPNARVERESNKNAVSRASEDTACKLMVFGANTSVLLKKKSNNVFSADHFAEDRLKTAASHVDPSFVARSVRCKTELHTQLICHASHFATTSGRSPLL